MSILLKSGVIKGEKQTRIRQSFNEGEQVKITEGPFASFTGTIKEISLEKEKLTLESKEKAESEIESLTEKAEQIVEALEVVQNAVNSNKEKCLIF